MADVILQAVIEAMGSGGPATLSLPNASADGATAYTGSVHITQAGGTLWRLAHLSAENPNAAAIKNNGVASTPGATGVQALSGSGLSQQTTYKVSYYHETASGQGSNVVRSSSFTTSALGSGSGTATISILKRSGGNFDPEGFTFQCATTGSSQSDNAGNRQLYDPSYHNLVYVWDFGDPGAVSDKVENLPAIWNDLNRAYGKEVAHVYTSPGTYAVSVTVYEQDGSLVGTDSLNITVGAADTLWTGSDVILVNSAGQGDSAYPGATIVTSWNAAMTEIGEGNNTKMVLLKRGQTYAASAGLQMTGGNAPNVFIGTYGSGARPVVTFSGSGSYVSGNVFAGLYSSFDENFVLQGIEFVGPWNVTTETGTALNLFDLKQESRKTAIVDDCIIRGFSRCSLRVDNGGYNYGLYIHNTQITDWKDYGLFCGDNWNQKIAVLGSQIAQNEQARSGYSGNKGDNDNNTHGPIRCSNGGFVYIACSDLFSRTGWGTNKADQPCLRIGTSPQEAATARYRYNVERNAMEGGYQMVLIRNENQNGDYYGGNYLFDKNLMVGTAVTWSLFAVQYSGVTIRNILGFKPNAPGLSSFPWQGMINGVTDSPNDMQDNRAAFPNQFYANTYVNQLSNSNRNGRALAAEYELSATFAGNEYTHENYVMDAPNASGQGESGLNLTTTPIATVSGTWTSRYLGEKYSGQTTMNGTYATPANSVYAAVPGGGSAALGDAGSGLVPYDDLAGALRGNPADRGAREA